MSENASASALPPGLACSDADVDPRIRRTRQMLFAAFKALLEEKGFEAISVQDIAERSTVNRATFYDHFTDKFALLDAMIGDDFRNVMRSRLAHADGSCRTGIRQLVLAVCDYLAPLASAPCQKARKQFEPMVEARLKTMVRDFLATPLRAKGRDEADVVLRSTVAAWAICGAALEWVRGSKAQPADPEAFADSLLPLVLPSLACPGTSTHPAAQA